VEKVARMEVESEVQEDCTSQPKNRIFPEKENIYKEMVRI